MKKLDFGVLHLNV